MRYTASIARNMASSAGGGKLFRDHAAATRCFGVECQRRNARRVLTNGTHLDHRAQVLDVGRLRRDQVLERVRTLQAARRRQCSVPARRRLRRDSSMSCLRSRL